MSRQKAKVNKQRVRSAEGKQTKTNIGAKVDGN